MADKDLQTILSSGDVPGMKMRGTTTENNVLIQEDLTAYAAERQELLLFGFSTATDQQPSALDTPLLIEFGAAQGTVSDPVMVDAAGKLTFNEAGEYTLILGLTYGRTGSVGTSVLIFRQLDDGVQVTTSLAKKIESAEHLDPLFITQVVKAEAGRTIEYEFYRDSVGTNFGGLFQVVPTLSGWGDAPSAAVAVFRA